jgi:4-hydroxy-4-methyl-2-oxoglutarate aldolase
LIEERPRVMDGMVSDLSAVSSATLHEVAGRIGCLPASIKPADPTFHIGGPAFPVRCQPGNNLQLHQAVYAASAGDVLVADVGSDPNYGYWGELLSVAASVRRLGGLVINGCVRDCLALAEVGFPVFGAGVFVQGTGKDGGEHDSFPDSVQIGNVVVHRGDLVVGDADGVVAVPAAIAQEMVRRSYERMAAERVVIERLRSGETTIDILGLHS